MPKGSAPDDNVTRSQNEEHGSERDELWTPKTRTGRFFGFLAVQGFLWSMVFGYCGFGYWLCGTDGLYGAMIGSAIFAGPALVAGVLRK